MRQLGGVLVATAGGALVLRSALLLLGRGRPRRGPQPAFVIAGPYRRVRNPLFAGCVLISVGTALWLGTTTASGAALALAIALDFWVRLVEEPRLRERFGTAYAVYLTRVPRWWPRATSRRG